MFFKEISIEKSSPSLKLLILVMIVVVCLLFTSIFGTAAAMLFWDVDTIANAGAFKGYADTKTVAFLRYFQMIGQTGFLIIPPLLFAFLVRRKVWKYLKLHLRPDYVIAVFSVLLILIILPLVSWLGEINQAMQLPDFLSGVENWMKQSEEKAMQLTLLFLNTKSLGAIILNLIMIALIPGIGEEMLFRGVLLRLFREWSKNTHVAVMFSAILFSALHLQFYGFLPRLVLGLLLGYMFVWSGSLWVPALVHFVNNAIAIIYFSATGKGEISVGDIESFGSANYSGLIIMSCALAIFLLYAIYIRGLRISVKRQGAAENTESYNPDTFI